MKNWKNLLQPDDSLMMRGIRLIVRAPEVHLYLSNYYDGGELHWQEGEGEDNSEVEENPVQVKI